jgi:glycosyltransferase involved in cell wall biosynthesis
MTEERRSNYPNLLFFCEFPPSNNGGGPVTVRRLLADYPSEHISVLTSRCAFKSARHNGKLECRHYLFPRTNRAVRCRWGIGRIKEVIDLLLLPVLVLAAVWRIKRERVDVIMTIAHGDFLLAVALASALTATPFIMLAHDDWVEIVRRSASILKYCQPERLFRRIARQASRIYAVSPYMQQMLGSQYEIEAELQMSALEPKRADYSTDTKEKEFQKESLCIVYAGSGFGMDCLSLLAGIIKEDKLKDQGINSLELHLFIHLTPKKVEELGWDSGRIIIHGWVGPEELYAALAEADILFLPFSFQEKDEGITRTSFPTKAADYLASETAILICAPAYSSLLQYAGAYKFAEVVDELNEKALMQGILNIFGSEDHRRQLRENARSVFEQNHNLTRQRAELLASINKIARVSPERASLSSCFEK